MTLYMRALFLLGVALTLPPVLLATAAHSQSRLPLQRPAQAPRLNPVVLSASSETLVPTAPAPSGLLAEITLGDIGYVNGLRFSNLGGHREIFVPVPTPEGDTLVVSDLILVIDDVSAHDARRNLEVQVNDRTMTAIALDGHSRGRTIRVSLGKVVPRDGYLKLSFLYSGAATVDHCIDVRAVGDTLTIDPETGINISVSQAGMLGVGTTAALMPRDVAVILPPRRAAATEIATAITVARSLISRGRRVSFYRGYDALPELSQRDADGRWTRGIILVGPLAEAVGVLDSPVAKIAGDPRSFGMLETGRINGLPVLVISDTNVISAGRLFASPLLAITRGVPSATAGTATRTILPTDRVTFDQLAVAPAQAEVYGRADLVAVIDTRRLPSGTRPTRLLLDLIVSPDGAGEKAVVSVFVNERLLGSTIAATGDVTHLDLALPDGLVGTIANVRAVIERDSAQGDCRFEPQGYPAQLLGSSSVVLTSTDGVAHDFSDLSARFEHGLELLLPVAAADQPSLMLGLVAEVVHQLSPDVTPLTVNFTDAGSGPTPDQPFIAVSDIPPAGILRRVSVLTAAAWP
jgi:hypothetical protein